MFSRLAPTLKVVCLFAACAPFVTAQTGLVVNKYQFSGNQATITASENCINSQPTNVTSCPNQLTTTTGLGSAVLYVITISNNSSTTATPTLYDTAPAGFVASGAVQCYGFQGATVSASICGTVNTYFGGFTIPQGGVIVIYIYGALTTTGTQTNFVSTEAGDTQSACRASGRTDCTSSSLDIPNTTLQTDLGITKGACILPPQAHIAIDITCSPTLVGSNPFTVSYAITITNHGPGDDIWSGVIQVADTITNLGGFPVNYSFYPGVVSAGNSCSNSGSANVTCVEQSAFSGTLQPYQTTSPSVASNFSGFIPVGSSVTLYFSVTFTYSACTNGTVQDIASFGYSNYSGTVSDSNPSNNTSNDPPLSYPTNVTLLSTTNVCPPILTVTKTQVSPSNPVAWGSKGSGQVTYRITLTTNSPVAASTLTDYISKTLGTPVFTPSIIISTIPFTPIFPPNLGPVDTNNTQFRLFTASIPAIAANGSFSFTYTVEYDPECETNSQPDEIDNYAEWTSGGVTAVGVVQTFLDELPPCQLTACKMNYRDTNPNPSITDCTNSLPPFSSLFSRLSFPGAQDFTIFFQNFSTTSLNVGTVRDVLSIDSPTYGSFPVNDSYTCKWLPPGPTGTPPTFSGSNLATIAWNNPAWAGVQAFDLGPVAFPAGSTLMCSLSVSTLGSSVADLPTGCQSEGMPRAVNSALMDLSQGINFLNSSNTPPTPFSQAYSYLPLCQNVSVSKEGSTLIGVNGTAAFTITALNNESVPLLNFTLTDTLPPGFAGPTSVSCMPTPCSTTAKPSATISNIPAGQTGTLSFDVARAPKFAGTYHNVGTGTFASCPLFVCPGGVYSGGGNLVAGLNVQVLPPTLKKAFGPQVGFGATLTFTITNIPGNPTQNGMRFSDKLPVGLFYVPGSVTSNCGGHISFGGTPPTTLTLSGGILNAGASSCAITVQVEATSCGSFTNGPSNIHNLAGLDASDLSPSTLQVTGCELTINKNVVVKPKGTLPAGYTGTFNFTVICNGETFTASITLPSTSTTVALNGVPAGAVCRVTEGSPLPTAPPGFSWTGLPPAVNVTMGANGIIPPVTVTNYLLVRLK